MIDKNRLFDDEIEIIGAKKAMLDKMIQASKARENWRQKHKPSYAEVDDFDEIEEEFAEPARVEPRCSSAPDANVMMSRKEPTPPKEKDEVLAARFASMALNNDFSSVEAPCDTPADSCESAVSSKESAPVAASEAPYTFKEGQVALNKIAEDEDDECCCEAAESNDAADNNSVLAGKMNGCVCVNAASANENCGNDDDDTPEESRNMLQVLLSKIRIKKILVFVLGIIIGIVGFNMFFFRYSAPPADENMNILSKIEIDTLPSTVVGSLTVTTDSINNVAFRLITLKDAKAQLQTSPPMRQDTTVLLAVPAADFRRDNGSMVGDFVIQGQVFAHGKRKTGYCAITDGKVIIGNSDSDDMLNYCIENNADFFRQYILVFEGQMQENQLRGKAYRRALAQREGELCIVETMSRESLYDFSQALADYGFTSALYLVGAASNTSWREDLMLDSLPKTRSKKQCHPNYLVFRK